MPPPAKFELAYTRGVARLLSYFKGSNDKKESMDVTSPTLAEVQLDKHGKAKSKDYSFSLWLPEDVQVWGGRGGCWVASVGTDKTRAALPRHTQAPASHPARRRAALLPLRRTRRRTPLSPQTRT